MPSGSLLMEKSANTLGASSCRWRRAATASSRWAVSSVVAVLGTWLLQRLLPAIPIYFGLVIGVLALVGVLAWVARRFVWIMPWYTCCRRCSS